MAEMFDAMQAIGAYQSAKDRRVNDMLMQRKIAAEDRALQREERISSIYKNIQMPGMSNAGGTGMAKGGGQASGGLAAAYTPEAPPTVPMGGASAPTPTPPDSEYDQFMPRTVIGADGQPQAAAPGAPPFAPKPAVPFTQEDHSWLQANAPQIQQLMGLDPKQGMELYTHFKALDDTRLKQVAEGQDALVAIAYSLKDLPYQERRAALMQAAPSLIQAHAGLTPEMINQFDPTDQNIQMQVGQALGVKGMAEQAFKTRQQGETERHNRVTEGNAAGGLAVRQGALGLASRREGRVAAGGGKGGSGGADRDSLVESLIQ